MRRIGSHNHFLIINQYQYCSMKKNLFFTCLILAVSPLFFSCRERAKEGNKNNASTKPVSRGQKYVIDTKESVVTWKGAMLVGANSHAGYASVSKGELMVDDDQLVGGTAEVGMNTILDESHRNDNELIRHLKSADFFDTEKFPVSTIDITGVTSTNDANNNITGNLTIKGITHPVSFPAQMQVKDGIANATGKLVIDRTDWDVRYRSGKFYDLLADKAIADSIEINIKIVARK